MSRKTAGNGTGPRDAEAGPSRKPGYGYIRVRYVSRSRRISSGV